MSYKYAFFFLDCQILMLDLQKIDCSDIFRFPEYCLIRKKNIPLLRLFPTRYCMRETKHRDSRHRYQECTYQQFNEFKTHYIIQLKPEHYDLFTGSRTHVCC